MFYVPLLQHPEGRVQVLVRSARSFASVVASIRREIRSLDANVPLLAPARLSEQVDAALAQERLGTRLLGGFGLLTLLISVTGIVGSISYLVARRTREIAVRLALGASPARIVRMVIAQGATPVMAGLAGGLALSLWTTRFLAHWLVDVNPIDPLTLAGTSAVVMVACVVASYLPARRAAKVDPVVTLRTE
jgi:ABC-type antimicrobial peptide transport system permease subunit